MHDVRHNEYHPDEYEDYLKSGYVYNMIVSVLDVSFFFFALSVVSASVVLPAFMLRLGASAALVALLPAVQVIGLRLPQIITPFLIEGRIRQKPYIVTMNAILRSLWVLMVPLVFLLAESHPRILLTCFLSLFFAMNFLLGLAQPSWGDLIAKVIPKRRRGSFMGMNMMLGHALGIIGGVIVSYVMNSGRFDYPLNYAVLFLVSSVIFWISFAFFTMTKEPIIEVPDGHESVKAYIASLGQVLKTNRRFVRYIVFTCLLYSFVMGNGLFMAYGVSRFGPVEEMMGRFVMASTVAVMVVAPIFGIVADRAGHGIVLLTSILLYIGSVICAMLAVDWISMYPTFILAAVGVSAWIISMRNMTYELAPEDQRPRYLALVSTIPVPMVLLFSVLGGWLADRTSLGYLLPFIISICISCAAIVVLITGVGLSRDRLKPQGGA